MPHNPPNPPTPHTEPSSESGAETTSSSDFDYIPPASGYGFAYDSEVEARHAAGRALRESRAERESTTGSSVQLREQGSETSGETGSSGVESNGWNGEEDGGNVADEFSDSDESSSAEDGSDVGGGAEEQVSVQQQQQQLIQQWDEQYNPDLEEGPLLRPPPADRSSISYITPTPAGRILYTTSITATLSGPSGVLAFTQTQHVAHGEEWMIHPGLVRRTYADWAEGRNHEFRGRNRDQGFEGRAYAGESGEEDASAGAQQGGGDGDMEGDEGEAMGGHAHHVPYVHRRIFGERRGGNTYGGDYSDDDDADDEMSPEPAVQQVNAQRNIPNAVLYGDPLVSAMVANTFMDRYTQAPSPVVADAPPNTECPICLEPPSETHECVQIRGVPGCTHLIGRSCLRQWFINRPDDKKDCPFCRTQWVSQQGIWDIEDELVAALRRQWEEQS